MHQSRVPVQTRSQVHIYASRTTSQGVADAVASGPALNVVVSGRSKVILGVIGHQQITSAEPTEQIVTFGTAERVLAITARFSQPGP